MDLLAAFDIAVTLNQAGSQLLIDTSAVLNFALAVGIVAFGCGSAFKIFRQICRL